MGVLSEEEILKNFFSEGRPPKLLPLSFKIENDFIILSHPNKGSSIIWKIRGGKSKSWNIYNKPLANNLKIIAKAVMIGYDPSDLLELN